MDDRDRRIIVQIVERSPISLVGRFLILLGIIIFCFVVVGAVFYFFVTTS